MQDIVLLTIFLKAKMVHEIFTFQKRRTRQGWVTIKLNSEKAYEKLECEFIQECFL